ncbi:glutamine amidotransferase-like class 1 domain-containing protein 1 [Corticium candelabrum]|uniref:glutamine amidotransferase-like class 1 domain-containing protein 1 n=1 Tax=Corticium candelabrum TaxID=121492 RepID=UPI002E25BAA5|nr:glutamine amidotransferase-like class 1 domain-containing protein 1 [Corticium candelabrum]
MSRPNCLIVCSASLEGVSAQSFIHSHTLTSSAFNVQIATPEGQPIRYVRQDDGSRRWLNDFKGKPSSQPTRLESIDASVYSALLIPSAPGALRDLAKSQHLGWIINSFMTEEKCICAVGGGVAGLCSSLSKGNGSHVWCFKNVCLTGPSVNEVVSQPDFTELPIIIEDFLKDHEAVYSASQPDCVHVVIDRNVITGQNDQSTLSAVQNLILLSNSSRQGKPR